MTTPADTPPSDTRADDIQDAYNSGTDARHAEDRARADRAAVLQALFALSTYGVAIVTLLVAATVLCVVWAYRAVPESFSQAVAVSLASGIGTFVALPVVLKLAALNQERFLILAPLASLAAILGAWTRSGVTQDFLVEISVSILFVMALELFLGRMLTQVFEKRREASATLETVRKKIAEARTKGEQADAALDYYFAEEDRFNIPRIIPGVGVAFPKEE